MSALINEYSVRVLSDYLAETEFVHYLVENGASASDIIPSVNGKLVECIVYAFEVSSQNKETLDYEYIAGRAEFLINSVPYAGIVSSGMYNL